jgi:hypothetical protein
MYVQALLECLIFNVLCRICRLTANIDTSIQSWINYFLKFDDIPYIIFYIHIDIQSCWHPLKSITAFPHNKYIHFLGTSACSELRFELRFTLLL